MSKTISVVVAASSIEQPSKGLFPKSTSITCLEISSEKIKEGLEKITASLEEVLSVVKRTQDGIRLKEVEVGIEISAEGGIALVGTASIGASANITLKFER